MYDDEGCVFLPSDVSLNTKSGIDSMPYNDALYEQKLMTAKEAAEIDMLFHGLAIAEPSTLPAIAARVRSANLKKISLYSLPPLEHAAKTIMSPELCDMIHSCSFFISGPSRNLVKIGLTYFVPNYFHQLPRPFREFIKTDVLVTTRSVPSGLSRRPCRHGEFDHGIDHQESRKQLKV